MVGVRQKAVPHVSKIPTGLLIIAGLMLVTLSCIWLFSDTKRGMGTTMFSIAPESGSISRDSYSYGTSGSGGAAYQGKPPSIATIADPGVKLERRVVRSGMFSILVSRTEDAAHAISGIAERLGGYTEDAQIYEVANGVKNAHIVIRVPEDKFTTAMSEIRQASAQVEKESTNSNDVTQQVIDLDARLKNLRSEEKQYQDIMERTEDISDTLQVAQQLSNVRGQIEQLEAQQKYLTSQVAMSRISVSITSESDVEVFGVRWRPLYAFKQSLRALFAGVSDYVDRVIAFIVLLPLFVLWLATVGFFLYLFWKLVDWIRRKLLP